jgi:transcription elongation factor GreA
MDEQTLVPPDRPPRRPGQEPSAHLTLEAYQRLRGELDQLRSEGRHAMGERLLRAREHGDIRENAEYDAAKDAQGLMEARIRFLERLLKDPEIVEAADGDAVAPGTVVTLRLMDVEGEEDEDESYLIAMSAEERAPGVRTMTASSPLGSALMGKSVGDQVTYKAPGGEFTYEVLSIEPYRPSGA